MISVEVAVVPVKIGEVAEVTVNVFNGDPVSVVCTVVI